MTDTLIQKLAIAILLITAAVYGMQKLTEYASSKLEKAAAVQTMARR